MSTPKVLPANETRVAPDCVPPRRRDGPSPPQIRSTRGRSARTPRPRPRNNGVRARGRRPRSRPRRSGRDGRSIRRRQPRRRQDTPPRSRRRPTIGTNPMRGDPLERPACATRHMSTARGSAHTRPETRQYPRPGHRSVAADRRTRTEPRGRRCSRRRRAPAPPDTRRRQFRWHGWRSAVSSSSGSVMGSPVLVARPPARPKSPPPWRHTGPRHRAGLRPHVAHRLPRRAPARMRGRHRRGRAPGPCPPRQRPPRRR